MAEDKGKDDDKGAPKAPPLATPEVDHTAKKLGRREVVVPKHSLRLKSYALVEMTYPPSFDGSGGFKDWGDLANSDYGDCTIAGAMHLQQAVSFTTYGNASVFTSGDAIRYYQAWNGFVPGHPDTDNGGIESEVLDKWLKHGLKGHHIVSFGYLDPKDTASVKHFCAALGGLYIGAELPNSCMKQDIWDVAENDGGIAGGHCVYVYGYDEEHVLFVSWGQSMKMTWDFWNAYVDECWGVLAAAHVKDGYAGNVDVVTLQADAARHLRRG